MPGYSVCWKFSSLAKTGWFYQTKMSSSRDSGPIVFIKIATKGNILFHLRKELFCSLFLFTHLLIHSNWSALNGFHWIVECERIFRIFVLHWSWNRSKIPINTQHMYSQYHLNRKYAKIVFKSHDDSNFQVFKSCLN